MLVGSFYELYDIPLPSGDGQTSMKRAVEIMGIQLKIKKEDAPGGHNGWFAGFPESQLHKFAALLTRENWTVVVIDQAKDAQGKVIDRPVGRILSPGTHVEASAGEAFYMGGLWLEGGTWAGEDGGHAVPPSYAAVAIDLTTGAVITFEGAATGRRDTWHSDELLHFFQVHPPRELTVWWRGDAIDCPAEGMLRRVLGCPSSLLHVRPAAGLRSGPLQKQIVREDLLRRCFKPKSLLPLRQVLGLAEKPLTEWVLTAALLFVEDHFPSAMDYLHPPRAWNPREAMVLGNHALTQLNMITGREEDSVLGLFLRTYTTMGRRAMRQRLLFPGCLSDVLEKRYEEVAWCQGFTTSNAAQSESAISYLRQVQDLARLHRRICVAQTNAADVLALDQSYTCMERIAEHLLSAGSPLAMPAELQESFTAMRAAFAAEFSVEKARCASEELFCMTETAGPQTMALEADIRATHARMQALYRGLVDWLQETPETLRLEFKEASVQLAGGKGLMGRAAARLKGPVPPEYAGTAVHAKKASASMEVPALQGLYMKILGLRDKLARSVRLELPPVCDRLAAAWSTTWDALEAWISHVDVSFTLARVAGERGFSRPVLMAGGAGGALEVTGLRHPLIEGQQTRVEYVRHDVRLGVDPTEQGWLVYGMNASGKSSLMKAVGIAVLLAQCGSFVPAESFQLTPFQALYTRILNTDNLWAGLSSFAVEMTELREILARADQHALVLGDEVCSGTESESATALVAATLTYFQRRGVRYIFATHLHGLQAVKEVTELPGLRTWHLRVRHDVVTDRLIYERTLQPGAGSSLYGLEVAKAMGLPAEVLESARRIRRDLAGAATEAEAPASAWNTVVQRRTCELCGAATIRDLEVHHIRPRAEAGAGGRGPSRFSDGSAMNALRNLVVVCQACHDAHHAGALDIGPVQQTSDGPVRSITELAEKYAYKGPAATNTKPKAGGLTAEQLGKVEEYLRNYPLLPAKRVAFDLLEREGIKVTEQRLRTIRAGLS
jgi:DNA mismatch repair protein MutS